MKFFLGTLSIDEDGSRLTNEKQVLVAAQGHAEAMNWLIICAGGWGDNAQRIVDGYRYDNEAGSYTVLPVSAIEIPATAFFGMQGMTRIGEPEQPTNVQDAGLGNENAIRHIAYSEGYADGKAAGHEQLQAELQVMRDTDKPSIALPANHGLSDGLGECPETVTLLLGIARHHHRHGEDVFLFQSMPSQEEAIDRINAWSSFEPEEGESVDVGMENIQLHVPTLLADLRSIARSAGQTGSVDTVSAQSKGPR